MRVALILAGLLLPLFASAAAPDPFLKALLADFKQDGTVVPPAEIVALYAEACKAGEALACKADTWHRPGGAPLRAGQELFAPACESGTLDACVVASWQLTQIEHGEPSRNAPDVEKGAAYLKKACDGGNQRACGEMSFLLRQGLGISADPDAALSLASKACEAGDGHACRQVGHNHRDGDAKGADPAQADAFYAKACEAGDVFGCWVAGLRGADALGKKAVAHYEAACEAGVAEGCFHLAEVHREGVLAKVDDVRAAELDLKACQGGEPLACDRLGRLYDEGRTVEENPAKAATLMGRACDAGLAKSCAKLARMLHVGRGVPADPAGGVVLTENACKQGIAWACGDLGMRWLKGEGTEGTDPVKAEALLVESCNGGTAWACIRVASLYRSGALTPSEPHRKGVGEGKTSALLVDGRGITLDGDLLVSWAVAGQARDADYGLLGVRLASALAGKEGGGRVDIRADGTLGAEVWVPAALAAFEAGLEVHLGPTSGDLVGPIVRRPLDGTAVTLSVGPTGTKLIDHWEFVDNDAAVTCRTIPCATAEDYDTDRVRKVLAGVKEKRSEVAALTLALHEGLGVEVAAALVRALDGVYGVTSISLQSGSESLGEPLTDEERTRLLGTAAKGRWEAKGDAWWAMDKAKLKVRQENFDEADALLRESLDKQPECGQCALQTAELFREQGRILAFLEVTRLLQEKYPKEGEPVSHRAYWYAVTGDLTRAGEEAERARAIDKKDGTVGDVEGKVASMKEEKPLPPPKFTILGSGENAHERMPQSVSKRFDRVIAANVGPLRVCYRQALDANPELQATVTFQLGIDADGAVVHVAVSESSADDEGLHSCLVDEIAKMSFPGAEGEGMDTVPYTLVLLPR